MHLIHVVFKNENLVNITKHEKITILRVLLGNKCIFLCGAGYFDSSEGPGMLIFADRKVVTLTLLISTFSAKISEQQRLQYSFT